MLLEDTELAREGRQHLWDELATMVNNTKMLATIMESRRLADWFAQDLKNPER